MANIHWAVWLAIAIGAEVFGSSMLKLSEGFTKPIPMVAMWFGYGISLYCLSLVLKTIPIGMAYAIWSGVGLILTAMAGVFVFGEKVDIWGIVGIGLILLGVVVLNVLSKMGH